MIKSGRRAGAEGEAIIGKLHGRTLERAHQERKSCRVGSGPALLTQQGGLDA